MFEGRMKKEDVEELVDVVMDSIVSSLEKNTPRLVGIIMMVLKQFDEQLQKMAEEDGTYSTWKEFMEAMRSLQEKYERSGYEGYR
ncbi:MAG: hypothetical protein EF807_00625 [Candidatus Methanolliviera hydrocarbonicum]|jgi:hypothetical protein|uniref:Uncharacterized protein n=1 Tax=Candidatus Methanolliviera hydrocarbonicum TaxID=2491085 RepID=A0A520KYV8_9EURY|nr:MAG: hypothetical protein EF807_00625 [Candidatus Methanolliviera hydrocarbonicum]